MHNLPRSSITSISMHITRTGSRHHKPGLVHDKNGSSSQITFDPHPQCQKPKGSPELTQIYIALVIVAMELYLYLIQFKNSRKCILSFIHIFGEL